MVTLWSAWDMIIVHFILLSSNRLFFLDSVVYINHQTRTVATALSSRHRTLFSLVQPAKCMANWILGALLSCLKHCMSGILPEPEWGSAAGVVMCSSSRSHERNLDGHTHSHSAAHPNQFRCYMTVERFGTWLSSGMKNKN